jgi:hypothetical protein
LNCNCENFYRNYTALHGIPSFRDTQIVQIFIVIFFHDFVLELLKKDFEKVRLSKIRGLDRDGQVFWFEGIQPRLTIFFLN